MKKIISTFLIASSLALAVAVPITTFAAYGGLVKCDGVGTGEKGAANTANGEVVCNFNSFVTTVAGLINWGFYIALPIAVALFAWAGILYITGTEGNIKKGKGIFLKTMIGFIIMLVAWLGVQTAVGWLGNSSSSGSSGQNQLPVQTVESLLAK